MGLEKLQHSLSLLAQARNSIEAEQEISLGISAIARGFSSGAGRELTTTEILLAIMEPGTEFTFAQGSPLLVYQPHKATLVTTTGVTHLRPVANRFFLRMAYEPECYVRKATLGQDVLGKNWLLKSHSDSVKYYIDQLRITLGDRDRKPRLIRSREYFGYGLFPDPSVMPNIGL